MSEKIEKFIEKARNIHGHKYDYSKVEYVNSKTKVCIVCPKHGEFYKTPLNHIQTKQGCPICSKENKVKTNKKITTEEFIKRSNEIHSDKYDYSKVMYIDNKTKVCIICPEHGEFWQNPHVHMKGFGCIFCSGKNKTTTDEFIEKAKKVHGEKYTYENVVYKNTETKVLISCPEHGNFEITPHHHLNGVGCPKCAGNYSYTTGEIIELFKNIHGNTYDYSKVDYINTHSKVVIICKKHGAFKQTPKAHLKGQGCPNCKNEYTKSETKLFNIIKERYNDTIQHYRPDFLKTYKNGKQEIDIFIPSLNIGIEYQGKQHFEPVSIFGGEKGYNRMKKLDYQKFEKCTKNGIKIYYFSYEKKIPEIYIDKIFINEEELISELKIRKK